MYSPNSAFRVFPYLGALAVYIYIYIYIYSPNSPFRVFPFLGALAATLAVARAFRRPGSRWCVCVNGGERTLSTFTDGS